MGLLGARETQWHRRQHWGQLWWKGCQEQKPQSLLRIRRHKGLGEVRTVTERKEEEVPS